MKLEMGWCLISYSISSTIFNNHSMISGSQDLRAPDDRLMRTVHPSIVETLPEEFPDLKHEFSKLESQMFDRYWLTSECKNCQNRPITNVLQIIFFTFLGQRDPVLSPWPLSCPMPTTASSPLDSLTAQSTLKSMALTELWPSKANKLCQHKPLSAIKSKQLIKNRLHFNTHFTSILLQLLHPISIRRRAAMCWPAWWSRKIW